MINLKKTLALVFVAFSMQIFQISAQSIKVKIYKNGSYDIIGSTVKIINCYPGLNNSAVKVLSVNVHENGATKKIIYNLLKGKIILNFTALPNQLAIDTKVEGLDEIHNLVHVAYKAEVIGANKVYRTPVIISGAAGIIDWPLKETESRDCESITGLIPDIGSTLVVSTRDYKKYISLFHLSATESNGSKKLADISFRTEKVSYQNLPTYYITENISAYDAMRDEANNAAKFMGFKNDKPQSYHWCSWYYTYYHLTEKMVSEYLKGFKSIKPSVNIQTFQIDAGYHPHLGDWLEPSHKFPNGIASSVKEIIVNGYKAGIWIGPYMVGNRSKLYADHPDWILKRNDGTPVIQMKFYGEERLWGVMDEETYILDTSNPAVTEYIRNVFRTFKNMGITFFKTDFMFYGWEGSDGVKRFKPGKTSSEYQREFFDMIRQEIGQDSYWLGCIAPFPQMLGYVDGMRMAGDIGPQWEASTGMFNEMKGGQHINNVWWQNDADAMIIREKYSNLTEAETKSIVYWVSMLGGVLNTSDLFHEIPKNRVELFRFIEPGLEKYTGKIPFIATNEKLEVVTRDYRAKKSHAVLFINRKNEIVTSNFSLKDLIGIKSGTCFNWDFNKTEEIGIKENLTIELKPHESKLIYISIDGKSPKGMNLGGKDL